ncbi:phosphatidylethanolamine-binding protein [Cladorrhinum sp. PSN259]|nr:phosphatidylethanolamine-binding protein [Cladorrhinum sp. PSN259]
MRNPPQSISETLSNLAPSSPSSSPKAAALRIHFPDTTVTSPGEHLSRQTTAPVPTFSVSATALGENVTIPNCDLSPTTSASSASGDDGTSEETNPLCIPRFLVAGLDLDPPFPSFPVLGPILHSMQADLALIPPEDWDSAEYIPLAHDKRLRGDENVAGYVGPSPPGLGSPHRYMFLMWEQPRGINAERIREEFGFKDDGSIGVMNRVRWDQEAFERKLGLGKPVAGNFFVCG